MTSYFVPLNDNGDAASYNLQAYADGTTKQGNWLTPDEYYSRFPQESAPVSPPTIEHVKAVKKDDIDANTNRIRDRDGLAYAGERFAMSEGAMLKWTGLMAAKDILPYPMTILTIDDKPFVLADKAALMQFVAAVLGYETAPDSPLSTGRILRARVEAAQTIEEVESVVDDRE